MLKDDNIKFQPWIDAAGGNEFAAVMAIAKTARRLAESTDNIINHSEALTWALTNEIPEAVKKKGNFSVNRKAWIRNYLHNQLALIDDDFVRLSVKQSFKDSLAAKKITYTYINLIDDQKKARVRVIINMMWYRLLDMNEED